MDWDSAPSWQARPRQEQLHFVSGLVGIIGESNASSFAAGDEQIIEVARLDDRLKKREVGSQWRRASVSSSSSFLSFFGENQEQAGETGEGAEGRRQAGQEVQQRPHICGNI